MLLHPTPRTKEPGEETLKAGRGGGCCWTGPQGIPPSPAGISLEASGNIAPYPAYITLHGRRPPLEQVPGDQTHVRQL